MAYSKIILNGETLMDVTSDTVVAGAMTSGTTATKNDGTKVTGTIVTKSAADLTASGSTVTVPGGYYSAQATKNVASTTHPNPTAAITSSTGVVTATHTQTTGYVAAGTTTSTVQLTSKAAATYNTSTADQTIASYRWLTGTQTIKSVTTSNLTAANIASGVVVKVGDANNASRITQVTGTYSPRLLGIYPQNATEYSKDYLQLLDYTKGFSTGTTTLNHSGILYEKTGIELEVKLYNTSLSVVFQQTVTWNGSTITLTGTNFTIEINYDYVILTTTRTDLKGLSVYATNVDGIESVLLYQGGGYGPRASISSSTGLLTLSYTTYNGFNTASDYVSTYQLTSQAAQTIYPSTADQTVASYRWLTGTQTFKSVTTTNLTAANIASGVVVKIGDSGNESRIVQITGTYGGGGGGYTADEIAMRTISGDISGSASFISDHAFKNCNSITTATFPSCTSIGTSAFYSCSYLTNISFPICTLISFSAFANCDKLVVADFPSCSSIGTSAFTTCRSLTTANFPSCTYIASYAFNSCFKLSNISFPICSFIGSYAFRSCYFSSIEFPSCTTISAQAFANCSSLRTISFPMCTSIYNTAFGGCSKLTSASFSLLSIISSNVFNGCSLLNIVNFPICTSIGAYAFNNCTSLMTISFPSCTIIGSYAFASCVYLRTNVDFPNCTVISAGAFQSCTSLNTLSFSKVTSIENNAFNQCTRLCSFYLNGVSSVPTLGNYAFSSTPIGGYSTVAGQYGSIFVPSSLYNSFRTATNWATYSARMVSV